LDNKKTFFIDGIDLIDNFRCSKQQKKGES